jgi:hypothetical protein
MKGFTRTARISDTVAVTGAHLWQPIPGKVEEWIDGATTVHANAAQDWARRLDPFSVQAVLAVAAARARAGLAEQVDQSFSGREGVCVGTAFGAQQTRVRYASRMVTHGLASTNPIDFPDSTDGAPAAHVALHWGLQGPSLTFVSGPNSAVSALVGAARQLAFGIADRMHVIVGEVFDVRLRQAIGDTLPMSHPNVGSAPMASLAEPKDAVVAFVLERNEPSHPGTGIALVGFLNDIGDERKWGPLDPESGVTTFENELEPHDVSGALSVMRAWLGVAAPIGNESEVCQDEAMSRARRRFPLPNPSLPQLAFLGPSK